MYQRTSGWVRPAFVLVIGSAMLGHVHPAVADHFLQRCKVVQEAQKTFPEHVRAYMQENKDTVVRACEQLDLGIETYFALGPVTKAGSVCEYRATPIGAPSMEQGAPSLHMAWVAGRCPLRGSTQYAAVSSLSETDFAAIARFVNDVASSRAAFADAIRDLPVEQRQSRNLSEFGKQLLSGRGTPIVRAFKLDHVLGIGSVFEVHLAPSDDDRKLYTLRLRKLLGQLALTHFAEGNN